MAAKHGMHFSERVRLGLYGTTHLFEKLRANSLFGRTLTFFSGFLLGYSVSVALGFTQVFVLVFGFVAGAGVLVSGSLTAYLTIQSLFITLFAGILYVLIRSVGLLIDVQIFQAILFTLIITAPLATLISRVRAPLMKISLEKPIELFSSILFAALVHFLRGRMPADAPYALAQMYGNEDNAGIIHVVTQSLNFGVSSNISKYGEFTNTLYLSAAGFTAWFGNPADQHPIAALTHWNITLLLMAWVSILAMVTLAFSGKRTKLIVSLSLVLLMSSIFALGFWPFVSFGHTSVIMGGLFTAALLTLTINERISHEHPFFFAAMLVALGFVAGTSWFPLLPFNAAVVGFSLLILLWNEYKKNNKKAVLALIGFFAIVTYNLLPLAANLASQSESLLQLGGRTLVAEDSLILIWILISCVAVWVTTQKRSGHIVPKNTLFLISLSALLGSSTYLFVNGLVNNSDFPGYPGYGASKYILAIIAFSVPVLWFVISVYKKPVNPLRIIGGGLALILAILVAQPSSQPVAMSFFEASEEINTEASQKTVVAAIQEALERDAEHILCVADYGFPLPDDRTAWEAYLCTRWGQSLAPNTSKAPIYEWGLVFLNRLPLSSLEWVRDTYAQDRVIVIRFSDPDSQLVAAETWWHQYVHPSWEVITVE